MYYTLPSAGYARTTDYMGTTDNYKEDPDVLALKENVRIHNSHVRERSRAIGRRFDRLLRVRVKPRGPRNASFYHTTIEEATHFDIYVGDDSSAEYELQRELDTGLTPSELRKMDKLKYAAKRIEWMGLARKSNLRQEDNPWNYTPSEIEC